MSKDNGGPASDRELLELAAKAAGYNVSAYDEDDYGDAYGLLHGERWNPLANDGDALRLAIKLELDLCIYASGTEVLSKAKNTIIEDAYENYGDAYAATRRAIVRAAAAIGSAMQ